ncbi:MAG: NADH-quinone oxidoreductase subunit M [Bacteroidota bacterium]
MASHYLSILLFTPLFFLLLVLALPKSKVSASKYLSLGSASLQVVVMSLILLGYKSDVQSAGFHLISEFQFVERVSWFSFDLGSLGIFKVEYFLGVDGLNITMLLLSAIVFLIASISSFSIQSRLKGYHSLFLLLSTSVTGSFIALDFFLFFLFFEFMLLPMYFLIGIWGGIRREYASIKFFIYTLAGSILILIVMIGLYSSAIDPVATGVESGILSDSKYSEEHIGIVQSKLFANEIDAEHYVHTFNMVYLVDPGNYTPNSLLSTINKSFISGIPVRLIAFVILFIGFAIKLPAVPFHTWLPDAHVEAPTPISVVLAGILLKVGGYGLIRIAYGIFPDGGLHFSHLIGFLGMFSILWGAMNALAMKDLKKMIAYSSVSHMGFILLGLASLTSEGINGTIFQMFSHGLISSGLFILAGVIYDRTHDRMISSYRGLAEKMPLYTTVTVILFFAGLGLPGFSGFVGELLVFLGAFKASDLVPTWIVIASTFGLLITAAFFLWTIQRMYFGEFWIKPEFDQNSIFDLTKREKIMLIPICLLVVAFGIFPSLLTDLSYNSIARFCEIILGTGKLNLELLKP